MHKSWKQIIQHGVIFASLRARNLAAAAGGRFRRIGARLVLISASFATRCGACRMISNAM
jgi:hypothetical protein